MAVDCVLAGCMVAGCASAGRASCASDCAGRGFGRGVFLALGRAFFALRAMLRLRLVFMLVDPFEGVGGGMRIASWLIVGMRREDPGAADGPGLWGMAPECRGIRFLAKALAFLEVR